MRPIDADKLTDIYTIYDDYGDKHTVIDASDITGAPTINAIVIPENATNCDMIKAMFPNLEWTGAYKDEDFYSLDSNTPFSARLKAFRCWWNAPYKGVQS